MVVTIQLLTSVHVCGAILLYSVCKHDTISSVHVVHSTYNQHNVEKQLHSHCLDPALARSKNTQGY